MSDGSRPRLQRLLPWIVSGGALTYIFGFATDWSALLAATRGAHLPAFVVVTFADKMLFFVMWTFLQYTALQRLVGPVPFRALLSLRGGSELLRAVSNPLADATFLFGVVRLCRGQALAVIVAASLPAMLHALLLLLQVSGALLLLPGGPGANRDVAAAACFGWLLVAGGLVSLRVARRGRWRRIERLRDWLERVRLRDLLPLLGWFVLLAAADVFVQGLATRAFGVPVDWLPLAARIPILYLAISLPAFGNFGTRELAWAALFSEYGERSELIAYAFATNALFLLMNVLIGVLFLPRAFELLRGVRRAQRAGTAAPAPRGLGGP